MASYKYSMNSLGSKYPIVAMAMNQVSDLTLAKAVRRAGAIPSLSIFNYKDNFQGLINDLKEYANEFKDLKLFLSVGENELVIPEVLKLILKSKIEFVELINSDSNEKTASPIEKQNAISSILLSGCKVFTKCLDESDIIPNINGIILKGNEGAGRGLVSTKELFLNIRKKYPELKIIVSGGIGSASEVKHYMDAGATGIGIGTLFAVSKESKISYETKSKMLEATSNSLKLLTSGASQRALIFTEEVDDYNNTHGLVKGIQSPKHGHVFAGNGIDHISQIKTVEEIVQLLVAEL